MKTNRLTTFILLTIIIWFIDAGLLACAGKPVAHHSMKKLSVHKTAEWEGEWISVSSQADAMEKRGIFKKAAALSKTYSAIDIRKFFFGNLHTDIMRVRIDKGTFTFLSADGTAMAGKARYAYKGFQEKMSGGREVQWHIFKIVDGYNKYPELICSEPHGVMGQWILLSAPGGLASLKYDSPSSHWQAMMFPADMTADAIVDVLDSPEFIREMTSLLPPKK